ncbi:hypothetical protein [Modestobacter sp. NPDC049651]|uniref:YciI family protein n=1 Tax=unclassified Modestobacter TaxID=2643866 RepID=UPI0034073802
MATFAVTLVSGPAWDHTRGRRDQRGWAEHAAFMDGLVDDGFVLLGGPTGDDVLLLVEAADEGAVRDRLAADPWQPARLLRTGTVRRWELWLDGRAAG